jgi:hypothetical protein
MPLKRKTANRLKRRRGCIMRETEGSSPLIKEIKVSAEFI